MSTKVTEKYPVVIVSNNKLTTTSKNVAEVFGKRHDDVLKAVRNLDAPEEFHLRNFAEISTKDRYGRPQPMIEMTRDGFTILVMGFTGPKAMKFKIAYIEAFNEMEQELSHRQLNAPAPAITETEILKSLLATNQTMGNLREAVQVLIESASDIKEIKSAFRRLGEYADRMTDLSNVESRMGAALTHVGAQVHELHSIGDFRRKLDDAFKTELVSRLNRIDQQQSLIHKVMKEEASAKQGLIGFLSANLPTSEAETVNTTTNVSKDNDPLEFLKDCCILDPWSSVESFFLHKLYRAWALSRYAQPLGSTKFKTHLAGKLPQGVTFESIKGRATFVGMKPATEKIAKQGW